MCVKINSAYYMVLDKLLGVIPSGVGGVQHIVARHVHTCHSVRPIFKA